MEASGILGQLVTWHWIGKPRTPIRIETAPLLLCRGLPNLGTYQGVM